MATRGAEPAAPIAARAARGEPWPLRLARRPPALVAAVALALGVLGLALVEWVGEPRFRASRFFLFMMPVYAAAIAYAVRGALHDLDALATIPPERREALRAELGRLPAGWLLGVGLVVVSFHVGLLLRFGGPLLVLTGRPGAVLVSVAGWLHILVLPFMWGLLLCQGWLFLRLGRELPRVDLLDLAPLAPFVRVAFRLVLLTVLMLAAGVAFHLDWSHFRLEFAMLAGLPLCLVVEVLLFAFPLWGVHLRMREERDAELARVNAAIRGDRGALGGSLLASEATSVSTVDLLRYRREVEDFPIWPFGRGELLRLGFYGLIPLLGWVAGALVERLVDALLGGS